MESELQLDLSNRVPMLNDGIPPTLSEFLFRASFPQLSPENESMTRFLSSSPQGDRFKGHLQTDKTVIYNGMYCLEASSSSFPLPQEVPSELPRSEMFSSNRSYASTSSVQNPLNCGYDSLQNRFSPTIVSRARYLTPLQQILSEIVSVSLAGVDLTAYSSGFVGLSSNSMVPSSQLNGEVRKSQLLGLLELVDECYSRCLDEIHTVISAFHAATELDPQLHSCFTLRTLSFFYKNLRDRISNEILVLESFEKSFIQKQWEIQGLKKRNDQQLWRPQRGLPERSVSILRAWMFENFLHPYPKDSDKHLLALKSGLTRSQVSNWFINARVRIWKPLVEEMCSELNRRKGITRKNNEGTIDNSNQIRSHSRIYENNQRFNT